MSMRGLFREVIGPGAGRPGFKTPQKEDLFFPLPLPYRLWAYPAPYSVVPVGDRGWKLTTHVLKHMNNFPFLTPLTQLILKTFARSDWGTR